MSSSPRTSWGALPNSHSASRMGICSPASDSNSSRYASPERFGSGLLKATSALTSRTDGAVVGLEVRLLRNRVIPWGRNCSWVLAPPIRLAVASNPRAGRLKALCSR
jgi:hypothetical protein